MSLEELRKKLRQAVRGEWAKPEFMAAQDQLSAEAQKIVSDYKKCAREGGKPITECYREAAEKAGLGAAYSRLWGKRK